MSVRTFDLFIGGQWRRGGRLSEIRNPFGGDVVARVCEASADDVDAAIGAAAAAAPLLRGEGAWKRVAVLRAIAAGIERRQGELAEMICLEAGKPIQYARSEAARAVETFSFAADEAARLGGELLPLDVSRSGQGRTGITRRVPRGPVSAITPFNFPLNLVAHKLAPALACGCPVVLKPAPETPATAMMLAEIVAEAGAMPGALSVVHAPVEAAAALIDDPRMRSLSFTGSAAVGWELKARAKKKHVTLELGGNAAVVVEPDADLERALPRIVMGAFAYSGQICISVQRILVAESLAPAFLPGLVEATQKLAKCGDPRAEDVMVGPLIRARDADRVMSWIEEARSRGARVLCGGTRDGTLIAPTILTNVDAGTKISCQEVFGPVVVVQTYRSFDEALGMVNDSAYGLQCGLYSNDLRKVWQAFAELEVGAIIHNDVPVFRVDSMPYGGVKDSGFGREGLRYAIEALTEIRLLALNP
ncbi:MAG TPA: aldehyde dehydrogenase family protein [Polyangia bacterium]|nr:aldehyde dehydrogenase family protein [Polyangia bacterium]